MRLLLAIEAQNCTENGLADILGNTIDKLKFVTDKSIDLENSNNYGNEFKFVSIIPSCMDDDFWVAAGWKERKHVWRKKREVDIRLRMNYDRFIRETPENQRLMFVDVIVKSIHMVQEKSKDDFAGERLISDILQALDVTEQQLNELN